MRETKRNQLPTAENCFACGTSVAHGLHLVAYDTGDAAVAEYVASEEYQGYDGMPHGGIITTLLDEIMVKAILAHGDLAVTGKLSVRFRSPIKVGEKFSGVGSNHREIKATLHTQLRKWNALMEPYL